MPHVLQIPAGLTPILRRYAIDAYALATEEAQVAADTCLMHEPERPAAELLSGLALHRARVRDAEEAIELLGDDFEIEEEHDVELNTVYDRVRLVALIDWVIDCEADISPEPDRAKIIATARLLERLQALRAEVEPKAA
jgi:hypothetical protein